MNTARRRTTMSALISALATLLVLAAALPAAAAAPVGVHAVKVTDGACSNTACTFRAKVVTTSPIDRNYGPYVGAEFWGDGTSLSIGVPGSNLVVLRTSYEATTGLATYDVSWY